MIGIRQLTRPYLVRVVVLVSCLGMQPAAGQRQEPRKETTSAGMRHARLVQAKQDFESRCSRCHGLDGRGGEHGPDISTSSIVQQLEDQEVFRIIRDGVPSKGMPSFDFLPANEVKALVNYLRSLGQRSSRQSLAGNPVRGKELFFGKADCGGCHMIGGKGGFLASDLTGYGGHHEPDEIREGILNPAKFHDGRRRVLEVETHKGERFSGVLRNEDNFSLQLLGVDGTFYMLMKPEIESMSRRSRSHVPDNYGKGLSSSELDDLVSYVAQSHAVGHGGSETQSH